MNDVENAEMDSDSEGERSGRQENNKNTHWEPINAKNIEYNSANFNINKRHTIKIDSDSESRGRASGASDINEEKTPSEFSNKFSVNGSPAKSKTMRHVEQSNSQNNDFLSKVLGFFSYGNNENYKEEMEEEAVQSNDEHNNDTTPNHKHTKDYLLYEIDSDSRKECIEMLKYYRPSYPNTTYQKIDRYLPQFIELDSPIPEELSLDYEFAKYDISSLIYLPEDITPEYSETLIKYETLSWFMYYKSDVFRWMNEKLVEKIEINMFPLILEHSLHQSKKNPIAKEFIITINGIKGKKFWHNTITKNFEKHKSDLLLGWINSEGNFVIPDDQFQSVELF